MSRTGSYVVTLNVNLMGNNMVVMGCTFRQSLLEGLQMLHLVAHMKSDRNSCDENEKQELKRRGFKAFS